MITHQFIDSNMHPKFSASEACLCHMKFVFRKKLKEITASVPKLQSFELLRNTHGKICVLPFNQQSIILSATEDERERKKNTTFTEA